MGCPPDPIELASCNFAETGATHRTERKALKKTLQLFPLSLPDEVHVSQAGRLHRDSGNISTRITYLEAYDAAPFRLTQWIPTNLEKFAEKLPGTPQDNLKKLLLDNTEYPLFASFGKARLSLATNAMPIRDQIINMPKRIVGESGETHLCVKCLRRDREDHGTSYIHRSHRIPGVRVCWDHGTRLLSACPFCGCPFEPKADLVMAPWEPCAGCGRYLPDATFFTPVNDATERELEFAQFAHDLLQVATKPLNADTLAHIYAKKIVEKGFTRGSIIDRAALFAAFDAHFGAEFLGQIDSAYRTGRNPNWVRFHSRSGISEAPLSRHLLLANFLFSSSEEFSKAAESALAWENETAEEKDKTPGLVLAVDPTGTIRKHRDDTPVAALEAPLTTESPAKQKIAAFVSKNSKATVAVLWKQCHGAMKQLHKEEPNVTAWLSELLDSTKASEDRSVRKQQADNHSSDDLSWAQKFVTTALALYSSSDKPIKATRNYIMRKSGWVQPSMPDPERFRLARKQLESSKESDWHYYARRIIWAKLTIGNTSHQCVFRNSWHF